MPDWKLWCLALMFFSTLARAQDSSQSAPSESSDEAMPVASAAAPADEASADEASANEASADEAAASAQTSPGVKTLSGMSILGNEEAPKSLVIVPWKSSEIGNGLSVNDVIDERARPVDKDVFLREVHYYDLRSGKAQ